MAQSKDGHLTTESVGENRTLQRHGARLLPTLAGAGLPSAAIVWVHAENIAINPVAYETAPPTVSRALIEPAIAGPFAVLMIAGAVFLAFALVQIIRNFSTLMRDHEADRLSWALFWTISVLEIPAILGMIVLSQYTGELWAKQHDLGSYMLFFGHAFAISLSGILIARLNRRSKGYDDARLLALRGMPAHAAWVAVLSFLFGAAYFSIKAFPDFQPFLSHLALTVTEMAVLLGFLFYFARYWRFLVVCADWKRG